MNNTKIEWCDGTWNPVTGCLHGCEYCYARKIANRFGTLNKIVESSAEEGISLDSTYFSNPDYFYELNEPVRDENGKIEPYPTNFYPTFHRYRLDDPQKQKKPRTIFVCSMADLFGDWVPDEWIEAVFEACGKAPQHRYLFLTKNPIRYAALANKEMLPKNENMWYGTTITNPMSRLFSTFDYNTFVSHEPLLEPLNPGLGSFAYAKWVIIGAETGNRKNKVVPQKGWIDNICEAADITHMAVFMKDSLIPIVGEKNMRREFPWKTEVLLK